MENVVGPAVQLVLFGKSDKAVTNAAFVVDAVAESIHTWPDWLVAALYKHVQAERLQRSSLLKQQTHP